MSVLWDTDVLSLYVTGKNPNVIQRATAYLAQHQQATFSRMTRYEIVRGWKAVQATARLAAFEVFCRQQNILPITEDVLMIAADLWAGLKQTGQLFGDNDLIIAATALDQGIPLATGNVAHFSRVPGLVIEDWTKP